MNGKPRVYFAGKIARENDWRHDIAGEHLHRVVGNDEDLFDPSLTVDCGSFIYVGPFFVGCGPGFAHGAVNPTRRKQVFDINRIRLLKADWVFAYIESADCYNTLIE